MNRVGTLAWRHAGRLAVTLVTVFLSWFLFNAWFTAAWGVLPGIDEGDTRQSIVLNATDCLTIALQSNLDISISKYDPLISEATVTQAMGEFDPLWSLNVLESEEKTPTPAQYRLFGAPPSIWARTTNFDTTFQGKAPTGTTYSLNFGSIRSESTYTRARGGGEPEYRGMADLTLTQPLLNGFGLNVNLAQIRIAKNNKQMSDEALAQTVMDTVSQVLGAYWDLVFARENLGVARQSLRNARDLVEQNKLRVEVGTAASIEVRQAEAGVKKREAEVISAIALIRDAEDVLKLMLNVHENTELWSQAVVPADKPTLIMRALDEDLSYATALQKRPELAQARKGVENSEVLVRLNRNALLPTINLQGSYGFNSLRNGFNEEVDYLVRGDDWKFFYGVVGMIPVGNRLAKGQYLQSQYERDKMQLAVRKVQQTIRVDVRSAIRRVETNSKLVETDAVATKLQERALEDEKKRYEVGVSTSYRVLEFEEDLARAKSNELKALVDYRKALIALDRAEGVILDRHNVEFVSPDHRW